MVINSLIRGSPVLINMKICSHSWVEPRHDKTNKMSVFPDQGFSCLDKYEDLFSFLSWATIWQNQQNECAPSEDSGQPGQPSSLISLRCALIEWLRNQGFFMRTAKTLIRLDGCPGWSESSLAAHSFCWSCHVAAQFVSVQCFCSYAKAK